MKLYNPLDTLIIENIQKIFSHTNTVLPLREDKYNLPVTKKIMTEDGNFEVTGKSIFVKKNNVYEDNETHIVFTVPVKHNDIVPMNYLIVAIEYIHLVRNSYTIKIIDMHKDTPIYIIKFDMYNFEKKIKIEMKEESFLSIVEIMKLVSEYVKVYLPAYIEEMESETSTN